MHPDAVRSHLSGWTCPRCHAFVPSGSTHLQCPSYPSSPPGQQQQGGLATRADHGHQYLALLGRIATALEAIAKALDKPDARAK